MMTPIAWLKGLSRLGKAIVALIASHAQLQELIVAAQEQRGMGKLARQIFGGSIIATILAAAAAVLSGIWQFFAHGGRP